MADQRKRNNDDSWFPWALMIFLFVIKAWPIALILLFVKLFADDEKKERTEAPPLQKPAQQRSQPMTKRAAQQGAVQPRQPMTKQAAPEKKARAAMRKAAKSPSVKKSNAWLLKIAGAALTFFGVMVTGTAIEDMLYLFDALRFWLPEMLQGLAFLAGGLAMLYSGFSARAIMHSPALQKELALKENYQVYAVLVVGCPDVNYLRTVPRKSADVVWR